MTYTNKQIDELIFKALDEEDRKYYMELEQPNIIQLYLNTFKGKNKWLYLMVTFFMFIIVAATFYSATMFFETDDTKSMLMWGFGFISGLITLSIFKIWFWMQMNNLEILREIKRIELQVAIMKKE